MGLFDWFKWKGHSDPPTGRGGAQDIDALNERAAQLHKQGRHREALAVAQQALSLAESELGEDHHATVACLQLVGTLLEKQGDLSGAQVYHERVLSISQRVLGDENPLSASCLGHLGVMLK